MVSVKPKGGKRAEIRAVSSTPDRIVEEATDGKRRTRGTYELRADGPGRTEVTFTNELLQRGSRLSFGMEARHEPRGEVLFCLHRMRCRLERFVEQ